MGAMLDGVLQKKVDDLLGGPRGGFRAVGKESADPRRVEVALSLEHLG